MIDNGRMKGVRFVRANASGGAMSPKYVVIHYDAAAKAPGSTVRYFESKACKVSAHFVVERDGTATQMVETNRKAFHAGVSVWDGIHNLNSCSVGIEIVNPGKLRKRGDVAELVYKVDGKDKIVSTYPISECVRHHSDRYGDGYWLPYTDAQIATVKLICTLIVDHYPECNAIIGHDDIAKGRKIDPGPLFPWAEVRKAVLDPDPEEAAKVEEVVAAPVTKKVVVPEIVRSGSKSWSVRALFGAIFGFLESTFGFLRDTLPEAKTETESVVDPLTSLGGMLKVNMGGIIAAATIAILVIVIYRHSRDKTELEKLRGE